MINHGMLYSNENGWITTTHDDMDESKSKKPDSKAQA
jgi:hypothetical protein